MNYQRIILAGNAAGDAQLRKSKDGDVTFASFRVGVADSKNRTTFFPIVLFGKSAEALAKLITKGREILVEGRFQVAEDRFDVVADRVELGGSSKKDSSADKLGNSIEPVEPGSTSEAGQD
jgi:single-strand DNA-binding protein